MRRKLRLGNMGRLVLPGLRNWGYWQAGQQNMNWESEKMGDWNWLGRQTKSMTHEMVDMTKKR